MSIVVLKWCCLQYNSDGSAISFNVHACVLYNQPQLNSPILHSHHLGHSVQTSSRQWLIRLPYDFNGNHISKRLNADPAGKGDDLIQIYGVCGIPAMMLHIDHMHLKKGTCSGPGPCYGQLIYFRILYDLYNLVD